MSVLFRTPKPSSWLGRPLPIGLLIASTVLPVSAGPETQPIVPGFDARAAARIIGHPSKPFRCAAMPAPVVDMSRSLSRYDPKDPTQSKVDPSRVAAVAEREKQLKAFATQLARMADEQLANQSADPAITRCVWEQLAGWAEAGAFLSNIDDNDPVSRRQAIMTPAWQIATYAAVALKVSGPDEPEIRAARAKALAWMSRLVEAAMAERKDPNPNTRLKANHFYWVGVAAAYTSALTQDKAMKEFALDALRAGLADVSESGALREEMKRGGRAAMYQQFATLPLAILIRFADANHVDLSASETQAVLRLIDFSAQVAQDPGKTAAFSGAKPEALTNRSELAWIDIVLPYVARIDAAAADRLDRLANGTGARPGWHIYTGGAATAVYDPAKLKPQY